MSEILLSLFYSWLLMTWHSLNTSYHFIPVDDNFENNFPSKRSKNTILGHFSFTKIHNEHRKFLIGSKIFFFARNEFRDHCTICHRLFVHQWWMPFIQNELCHPKKLMEKQRWEWPRFFPVSVLVHVQFSLTNLDKF